MDTGRHQPFQVAHLFFGPEPDHLARIMAVVPLPEAILACHVLVAIFEHEDRGLVDLEGEMCALSGYSMIHVGLQKKVKRDSKNIKASPSLRNIWRAADDTNLFTSAHAPVDFVDESTPDHFEQDDSCSWVQHLLGSRAICLVLHIGMCTWTLPVDADTHDVWYIDFSDARGVLG